MQVNITLSKKEKRHYFLYLVGMLLFATLVLSAVALYRFPSPFSDTDMHSVLILQEKATFDEAQKAVAKQMDSVFAKIDRADPEKLTPLDENDIQVGISDINNAFKITNAKDPRIQAYPQVAKFYKMYYDDKKSSVLIRQNIKQFTKQFEDCSVGYKNRQEAIRQRENALLSAGK